MSTTAPAPTTAPINFFGPLVSRSDVERAILGTLRSSYFGIAFYIAELERRRGLPPHTIPLPPFDSSFRGGIDFETFESDASPLIIAVVEPVGDVERFGGGEYGVWFESQIATVVSSEDSQDDVRLLADLYGIAVAACVLQHGGLGQLSNKTLLQAYPRVEWPAADRRSIARSVVTLRSQVQPVVVERYGPNPPAIDPAEPGPAPDPYAPSGDYPLVQKTGVTITADPLNKPASA